MFRLRSESLLNLKTRLEQNCVLSDNMLQLCYLYFIFGIKENF
jgi:hypothetical protein